MKKLFKVLLAAGAVIGGIMGVLYFLDKRKSEAYDDFEDDDFDDIFEEDDDRDYVTLDFENEAEAEADSEEE